MPSIETIMSGARHYVRDYPEFFRTTVASVAGTRYLDLPRQNVRENGLEVTASTDGVVWRGGVLAWEDNPPAGSFRYSLDQRSGVIALAADANIAEGSFINVAGYAYEWIADSDLHFHVENIAAEHQFESPGWTVENLSDVEHDVISLGSACSALIALLVEFSRDIDVATPEAVTVPATQRFRQLNQLLYGKDGLVDQYRRKAAMTGTGLERARMFTLRRVAQGTERLVPIYEPREYDDQAWPKRVFPRTNSQGPSTPPPGFVPARRLRNPNQNGGPNP